MGKRNVLGRGLGALIPGADDAPETGHAEDAAAANQRIIDIPLSAIEPNPHQPRMDFDAAAIEELAQSIREKGVLQPLLVRRFGEGYHLIAGERRLRAAKHLALETVPAIVMEVGTDQEMMELSLIENIQRENLNPVEEAKAYRMLIDTCYLTQEEVAGRVGKDRSTIANMLRLLALAPEVLAALQSGQISTGHARPLLALDDPHLQSAICREIIAQGLSVRKVEALVNAYKDGKRDKPKPAQTMKDPNLISLEEDLQRHFGTAVSIQRRGQKGKIEIEFYTDDDLERVLDLLRGQGF